MIERWRAEIRGIVQGVGFRPFVTRLAREMGLAGFVQNVSGEVIVEVEGEPPQLNQFFTRLESERPIPSEITDLNHSRVSRQHSERFTIAASDEKGCALHATSVDLAPCRDCLTELNDPSNLRYRYPFINCAQCGPRFTIVAGTPYDRSNTSMRAFELCEKCRQEFNCESDRRFHAQAVCCPDCGPQLAYQLSQDEGRTASLRNQALNDAVSLLQSGGILALKGIGGYQLLVAANNTQAVERLRRKKNRPAKPFAVMFLHTSYVRRYASLSVLEVQALESSAAPIVLLRAQGESLAASVAPDNPWLGAMLPASPLHYLLAQAIDCPLVVTSGNLHGEPMLKDDAEARAGLGELADGFLIHDRKILNFADDSVVRIVSGKLQILRSARGYAPHLLTLAASAAVEASATTKKTLLATGGHLKQAPVLLSEDRALCWPQVGDQGTLAARKAMVDSLHALPRSLSLEADYLVTDLHPDYATSIWAEQDGRPVIPVQHHHAHVAACMAEHGVSSAIGIAWDGTGLGADGDLWGSEFLQVTAAGYQRLAWLRPFPLPGGDAAARDGWRVLAGLCAAVGLVPSNADEQLLSSIRLAQSSSVCPMSSSMGRLFDAVATLTGLCAHSQFEGQAAMAVEYAAMDVGLTVNKDGNKVKPYRFSFDEQQLDWRPMLVEMLAEMKHEKFRTCAQSALIAARFHATLLAMVVAVIKRAAIQTGGAQTVALCGGCFQNRLLLESCEQALVAAGYRVIFPQQLPPGDGGLALGQAWVAARALEILEQEQASSCA